MKDWDVFISHASEDRDTVAKPLADALVRAGVRVWFDRFELHIGDSLREKIDGGLSNSTCGVVILSENFFAKRWPRNELNGLVALEEDNIPTILPIWHEIDRETVVKQSPILSDRLGFSTADGIHKIAPVVAGAILRHAEQSGTAGKHLVSQFLRVLTRKSVVHDVGVFLSVYPDVLSDAFGNFSMFGRRTTSLRPLLGDHPPDLSFGRLDSTAGGTHWTHMFFRSAELGAAFPLRDMVSEAVGGWLSLEMWLYSHLKRTSEVLFGIGAFDFEMDLHDCVILVGRRDSMSADDREFIRSTRTLSLSIRSYDWLVEVCAHEDRRRQEVSKVFEPSEPVLSGPPCPFCGQPLRTERARQCPHCYMAWHDPEKPKRLKTI